MHGFLPSLNHDFAAVFGALDPVWAGRLILTLFLSGLVGIERSTHERASGLRTHILVGLGACLITMAGAYGFADLHSPSGARDPFRLATYVVSGIGFLGAGAILRHGTTVRGLTTAASVWNVAGVGIAVGSGMGTLAAVTVGLVLFVLVPLQRWEARIRIGSTTSDLTIHLHQEGKAVGRTLALLSSMGLGVRRATVFPGAGTSVLLRVDLAVSPRRNEVPGIVKQLLDSPDVDRVETAASTRTVEDESDPDDEQDTRKPFVRSRLKPRDVTRRKMKNAAPTSPDLPVEASPGPAPTIVSPDAVFAAASEMPEGMRPPVSATDDEGTGSVTIRPRRPRPRV